MTKHNEDPEFVRAFEDRLRSAAVLEAVQHVGTTATRQFLNREIDGGQYEAVVAGTLNAASTAFTRFLAGEITREEFDAEIERIRSA